MQQKMESGKFLERLLSRTGEWYVVIAIIFAPIAASITLLLGFISERLNADYNPEVVVLLNKIEGVVIPTAIALVIVTNLLLSRNIRSSLIIRRQKPELFVKQDHTDVWRSTHTLIWKYAILSAIISLGFIDIPKIIILNSSKVVNRDQVIYSLIAGLITKFAFVPFSTVILDRLLAPVRQVFLPMEFSKQLSGLSKLKILNKTLAVVFFSLIITVFLITPIGYHQTTRVLYNEVSPYEALVAFQVQSIFVSSLAILFAFGLTYLFAKSVTDPLEQLMDSFTKVESGDLTTRAPVVSSDEISQLAIYFNRMCARLQELQSNLEKKVDERTSQLGAINEVGRVATSILDPEELLNRVVSLITQEFGYYYSALYLVDNTGQRCDLKAATGEAGQLLIESKHKVDVNSTNIIGRSILTRKAQISLEPGEKTARFNNPLLPYTRSEISLPLLTGDRILGALDVHSTQEAAFREHDVETLQNMANQVAISLDNARLFQETRERLNELRNIQKQNLREAWIDTNTPNGGFSITLGDGPIVNKENSVEFPIALRDQIIGQLMLEGEESLSEEDKNWIQAVTTQTALALENARLLEESQNAAMQEKFVAEITNKIWASTSINGVLQTTIRELGRILDATEATIELNIDEN
jgi:GAF domain-containing protein/HAMP domain-containing protein